MTTIIIDGEVVILEGAAEAEYWAKLPSSEKEEEATIEDYEEALAELGVR